MTFQFFGSEETHTVAPLNPLAVASLMVSSNYNGV